MMAKASSDLVAVRTHLQVDWGFVLEQAEFICERDAKNIQSLVDDHGLSVDEIAMAIAERYDGSPAK